MRSSAIVVPVLSFLLSACTSDAEAVAARLQECDLVGEGELGTRVTTAFYQPDACYRECLASATCAELSEALCATSIELLQRCDQRCAHRCADGALIGVELVCDGFSQCADESDEAGCAMFDCGGGAIVPARARCDGYASCPSGEDERGCPPAFTCASTWGGMISGDYYRCNGYSECIDGADERDCPTYVCDGGMTITHTADYDVRCDGVSQCYDGSDEDGCASLTPMCTTL